MTYGYSIDLRTRVLAYIEGGHTREEACEVFGVSRRTIYNWRKLKSEKGSLCLNRSKGYKRSKYNILEDELREYLGQHPDAYLEELADVFKGSISGISRALKRFKMSRKKSQFCIRNEMKSSDKSFYKA